MHLSFFTKMFGRSVQLSSNFGKTFSYDRDACWYKDNVYQADIYRKNNTCTSCVFNGFKYIILQNILFKLQSQLILHNSVDANSEELCEPESVSTGVLQHGQRYIYEFLWKTSLSGMGETNMHLTNTFKDELTSSLKQYSLMNSLQIANVLHFIHFMWLYTLIFFP